MSQSPWHTVFMRRFILVALVLGALALVVGVLMLRHGAQDPMTDPAGSQQTMGLGAGPEKTIGTSALSHGGVGVPERNKGTGVDQPDGERP